MHNIVFRFRCVHRSGEFALSLNLRTMKITIQNEARDEAIAIEIPEDFKLADLKAYVEAETGQSAIKTVLLHNNVALEGPERELKYLGIEDNDILILRPKVGTMSTTTKFGSSYNDRMELYRREISNNPQLKAQFEGMYPQLVGSIEDPLRFKIAFSQLMESQEVQNLDSHRIQEEWRKVQENPDDPVNQAKILELIREERIKENLQLAYDISPESFVPVHLLQIKLKINGHETHALVDSGAQLTIIHPKLAEEFGILNLIDKNWSGKVSGVGSATSKGRIHSVRVSLGESDVELPCAFTALETEFGVIFGLDMLKRHKCSINLAKDALEIGGMEIRFLSETEIQKNVKSFRPEVSISTPEKAETRKEPVVNPPARISLTPTREPSADKHIFSESGIKQLLSLGFTRDEAIAALTSTNGNVELAASLLFN